ncbi:MAG TPA: VOC family protein [Solirubrobacterales bacterium]|jgi:catechol 2,3-dioxygenase-like lactoylglutathione lyase family enzyme
MKIEFIASVALITADTPGSRELFVDALGLPLDGAGDYIYTDQIEGSKHFGLWPLREAAQACFGTDDWPAGKTIPQVSVEFEVASPEAVREAAAELEASGYEQLHPPREEPWGQSIARWLSGDGAILGISYVPSMHA